VKKKHLLILIIVPLLNFAQSKRITLNKAIEIAKKKSPEYKTNLNRNERNYWRFRKKNVGRNWKK